MPRETSSAANPDSVAAYTRPDLIIPRLQASDPAGIIKELSHQLRAQNVIGEVLAFYHAALNHDLLNNPALPAGFAIPHARSAQVGRLAFALGRTRQPVLWGVRRNWAVDQVFLIAVPATNAREYLALLSGIAGLARQPDMLAGLRAAADASSIFERLNEIHLRAGRKTEFA